MDSRLFVPMGLSKRGYGDVANCQSVVAGNGADLQHIGASRWGGIGVVSTGAIDGQIASKNMLTYCQMASAIPAPMPQRNSHSLTVASIAQRLP